MKALPDWLGSLSSLQKLSLRYCNNLMYLPMFHLTKSKHLCIADCPNLEKRCAGGSGEEWFQISHIPNIKINGKYIQGKDSEDFEDFDIFKDSEDDRYDYMQEDAILESNQTNLMTTNAKRSCGQFSSPILEQELLLLISNAGGAPFLWKARWKYPGMAVEAGCLLVALQGIWNQQEWSLVEDCS